MAGRPMDVTLAIKVQKLFKKPGMTYPKAKELTGKEYKTLWRYRKYDLGKIFQPAKKPLDG